MIHRRSIALLVALLLTIGSVGTGLRANAAGNSAAAGTVTLGDVQFPDTLNPIQAKTASARRIIDLMWDPLIRFDDQSRPIADLATDVPTISNGQAAVQNGHLTVQITLRSGLHWSDGQPITSSDVYFGWQVYNTKLTGPACAGTCDVITAVKPLTDTTVLLEFNGSYGNYLDRLPPVLPAHAFTSVADAATKLMSPSYNYESPSGYVTSGPYVISAVAPGNQITLVPNPQYSALEGPYLSHIIFKYFPTSSALISAVASGSVDESEGFGLSDLAALEAQTPATLHITPGFGYEQLLYNTQPQYKAANNPLANVYFRRALNMAIDRQALCTAALGLSSALCGKLFQEGPISPVASVPVTPAGLAYDLTAAKDALAQSGFGTKPPTLDLVYPSGDVVRAAEVTAISKDWEALGITVHPLPEDATSLTTALRNGSFQVALFAGTDARDSDGLVHAFGSAYAPVGGDTSKNNYGRVNDPTIDADFAAAAGAADSGQRRGDFADLDNQILSQAYMLTLFNIPTITTSDTKIGNFLPGPNGTGWNGFEWYSTTATTTAPTLWVQPSSPPLVKTHVKGTLSGDTTWDAANGPYALDNTVTVPPGATLTIGPGVTVYAANGASLQVNGGLVVNGTPDARVTFLPCVGCDTAGAPWGGIQFGSGADPASTLTDVDITDATTGVANYPGSTLDGASFEYDTVGLTASLSGGSLTVTDSRFENADTGLSATLHGGVLRVNGSTFAGNKTDMKVTYNGGNVQVNNDDMLGNTTHIVTAGSSARHVDATNTWWGTTSAGTVAPLINDCVRSAGTPCVDIAPLGTASVCGVPAPLSTPAPATPSCSTAVPTSTPTPTNTPTATPTPTDTPQPTDIPTDTPTDVPTDVSVGSGYGDATDTPTDIPTNTGDVTPTDVATDTGVDTPTDVPTDTGDVTPTDIPTDTGNLTPTDIPTDSSVSDTPTDTPTDIPVTTATQIPQSGAAIQLSPSTQTPGDGSTVTVTGTGFGPDETVVVGYAAVLTTGGGAPEQATITTGYDGSFTVSNLPVPANVVMGNYLVTAVGGTSHLGASAWLIVTAGTDAGSTSPAPSTTVTPTATRTPTSGGTSTSAKITIDKVVVMHDVGKVQKEAKSVKLGEATYFIAVFHLDNPGKFVPSGHLILSLNGKTIGSYVMAQSTYGGRAAFGAKLRFYDKKETGKLYAHFLLTLGPSTAKRDRRFDITAPPSPKPTKPSKGTKGKP